jgi:hypothetical protein
MLSINIKSSPVKSTLELKEQQKTISEQKKIERLEKINLNQL